MECSDLRICTFHAVQWELHTDVNLTAQYGVLRSPYMHINCAMRTTCWHEFHCAIWSSQISIYVQSTLYGENYMLLWIPLCNMEFSDLCICTFHVVWWELHTDVNFTAQYRVLRSLYMCSPHRAVRSTCPRKSHCAIWSSQISVYVQSTLYSENYMPT